MNKITPVILCGGSGTRLWPLSRAGFPKQFLVLNGTTSLFQQAVDRVNKLGDSDIEVKSTLIVTNEEHRFLASDQLSELNNISAKFLLESVGRNTAPALTFAALEATEDGDDPILVVTPADQTITDEAAFNSSLQKAVRIAADGSIVILGITPDRPETGFGYIKAAPYQAVEAFVEKPDKLTAEKYLLDGGFYWNAGIFVLRASVWLKALQEHRNDIYTAMLLAFSEKKEDFTGRCQFIRLDTSLFENTPSESIDYAVMEKCPGSAQTIKMIPLNAGWSDLGAWDAVWQVAKAAGNQDSNGNIVRGDVLSVNSQNILVQATSRLVGCVGVSDLVIIETPDAVLVANKSSSQDVKKIVSMLGEQGREEGSLHRKVHRPWGWYDSIDASERFKVKRIQVKPGASLSLQKHHHRAEHWIVVKGTAEVTCGEKVIILTENQSTYIPLGETHRLTNPGKIPLEIIEIQSGTYLGEDDIVRFDDVYGRKEVK